MSKTKHSFGATKNENLENTPQLKNYFVLGKHHRKSLSHMLDKTSSLNNLTFLRSRKHFQNNFNKLSSSPKLKSIKLPLEKALGNIYEGKPSKVNWRGFIHRKRQGLCSGVRKNEKKGLLKYPLKSVTIDPLEVIHEQIFSQLKKENSVQNRLSKDNPPNPLEEKNIEKQLGRIEVLFDQINNIQFPKTKNVAIQKEFAKYPDIKLSSITLYSIMTEAAQNMLF